MCLRTSLSICIIVNIVNAPRVLYIKKINTFARCTNILQLILVSQCVRKKLKISIKLICFKLQNGVQNLPHSKKEGKTIKGKQTLL